MFDHRSGVCQRRALQGPPKYQPRSIHEIERDVMRGKHVSNAELQRFIRHPKGQMLVHALRGGC